MNSTIVTACDVNYLWGAFLLVASLEKAKVKSKIKVITHGFNQKETEFLEQFSNVTTISSRYETAKSVCTQKPEALFSADTDYITWLDSDCMVEGDISNFLEPEDRKMQIRFRGSEENTTVFRDRYGKAEKPGSIPATVQEIWCKDINDLKKCVISTSVLTNCFTIHKKDIEFIEFWHNQMEKVIGEEATGVYHKDSIAYFMTDESVLNSLLAFSSNAPEIGGYPFDKIPGKKVIHFGMNPKPWEGWTLRQMNYYPLISSVINWCRENDIDLPAIPDSLKQSNFHKEYLKAFVMSNYRAIRYSVSSLIKKRK